MNGPPARSVRNLKLTRLRFLTLGDANHRLRFEMTCFLCFTFLPSPLTQSYTFLSRAALAREKKAFNATSSPFPTASRSSRS